MNNTTQATAEFKHAVKHIGAGRVYFYDIDTREEITLGDNYSGLHSTGASEYAIRDNKRYTDTRLSVYVVCFETKTVREVTAADFPGRRVAVKEWYPNGHWKGQQANETNVEWYYLADTRNGFQGNKTDTGKLTRTTLGSEARKEKTYE